MNLIRTIMLVLPSLALGAVLMGSIGLPLAYRRGRQRTEDEARIIEGVALAREHKPLAIAAHPLVEETLPAEIPIGAEPQVRVDITGRADGPRTSGNAAPPLDAQPPPRTGDPAGPQPRTLRELDRHLVMHDEAVAVTLGWRDLAGDLLETLDRLASSPRLDPLCAFLGRRERHWWTDRDHSVHNVLAPTAEPASGILLRLAIERASADPPIPDPGPNPRRYVLDPDWRERSGEIPVVQLGELVEVAT